MKEEFNPKYQRNLDALLKLHHSLENGIHYTPTDMVNEFRLNTYFATFLAKEKIILRQRVGRRYIYKWNSIRPNKHMVMKLIELCRTKNVERKTDLELNQKNKKRTPIKNNNQVEIDFFTTENKKYLEFLLEVYFKCKNGEEGFVRTLIGSYGIHNNAAVVLKDYGYLEREESTFTYKWLKSMPNIQMAEQFNLDMKDYRKQEARRYNDKKKEKTTTITKSYFFGLFKITKTT